MRKFILICLFFFFAPLALSLSLFGFYQIEKTKELSILIKQEGKNILGTKSSLELYSALPPVVSSFTTAVSIGDARPFIIKNYLEYQNSPLAPLWQELFAASEKYGLDYRLMVAIAQCESNLCKKIPQGSYNCWGFENGETRFSSWNHSFEQVAKTLKEGYYDQGLITPEEIMPKYAPPSVEKGGPWAKCVNQFLQDLE